VPNARNAQRKDIQWGLKRARSSGLRIVEPKSNELQIDLDGSAELAIYRQQLSILVKAGIAARWRDTILESKTPGRFHVTVSMNQHVSNEQRIMFQAILGSDIRREAFNLCRVLNGNKYPIVFFEKKP
jgi:hypothetical protein